MKSLAIVLTALLSTAAIAPLAHATPDFDQLRRENLDKDAIAEIQISALDFYELREDDRNKGVDFDQLRRENLDKDAVDFDQLRRENLDKDPITTPIV